MSAGPTHYERLGVASTATVEEIRAAYHRLARVHHPDAAGSAAGRGSGGSGGSSGADMALLNEAWRVLSDPGRRALYDAGVRGRAVDGPTGPAPDRTAESVAPRVPVAAGGRGRFPIWPFVIVFVLAVIFIVTAGGLSQEQKPQGPDTILTEGSCVTLVANADAVEVLCSAPHDGVVVTVVDFDATCPANTATYRDRQGRGYACLMDG